MGRRIPALLGAAALAAGASWAGIGAASATASEAGADAFRQGLPGRPVASIAEAERAAGGSTTARAGQTLILVAGSSTGREAEVDLPPRGESSGDFFLFEGRVFDRSGARAVGLYAGRCELGVRTFTCEVTVRVDGKGKIRVDGTLFSPRDSVLPVTGGTGAYHGVGGEVTVFDLPRGRTALVFHLVR